MGGNADIITTVGDDIHGNTIKNLVAEYSDNSFIFEDSTRRTTLKSRYISGSNTGNGVTEVCDLNSGECYTVREKDGLIERVDNTMKTNRKVQVETPQGFKQLLNG